MKREIRELWNGNIVPCERCGVDDPNMTELAALMARNKSALREKLTPQLQELFEKYIDCSEEYLLLMMEYAFCDGFSIASRLLTESLS